MTAHGLETQIIMPEMSINFAYGCIRLQAFRLLHHHFSITWFRQFYQFRM